MRNGSRSVGWMDARPSDFGGSGMKMFLASVAVAATALTALPASAAQLFYISGGNYDEMVHNDHQAAGTSITLKTKPSAYSVIFSADDTLTPNGNGFAKQDGPFSWVSIDPLDVGFTKMGFTLNPDGKSKADWDFDILVTFIGGGTQLLSGVLPSNGKVDVWAQGSEIMDSVKIFNLTSGGKSYDFADIRHTSFDAKSIGGPTPPGVPEPATWAMMIAGFGLAGAALRRRRAIAA